MKQISLIIIFLILFLHSFSQNETFKIEDSGITPSYKSYNDGKISITQDIKILQLVKKQNELSKNKFKGWRVQIYFNSGQKAMREAQNTKAKFLARYGKKHRAYMVYNSPYYKIQVGDFRTKAEALFFKNKIKDSFPNSWLIGGVLINYPIED